jgi:hypothetical protein
MSGDQAQEKNPDRGSGQGGENQGDGHNGRGDEKGGSRGSDHHGEKITIFVNERPVSLQDEKQTGLSIKEAAIAAGVPIQPDFVLSIERGGGKTELIGDDEKITVKDGDRFLAIPNDDNS